MAEIVRAVDFSSTERVPVSTKGWRKYPGNHLHDQKMDCFLLQVCILVQVAKEQFYASSMAFCLANMELKCDSEYIPRSTPQCSSVLQLRADMVVIVFVTPWGVLSIIYNQTIIVLNNLHSIVCQKWDQGFTIKMEAGAKLKTSFQTIVFLVFFLH